MKLSDPAAKYDVVIVGGGPVGLLMAYQLARFGVSAVVFEQHEKADQDAFGRAIAFFPRTLELLDQLELADPMLQLGFACRSSVTYKDGERVIPGRVWTFMENMSGTAFDFTLVLRQMYTEQILREKLRDIHAPYFSGFECVDFAVDTSSGADDYAVQSTLLDRKTGDKFTIQSKYLVGADGGRSFVRQHAGIPFEGDTTEDKWVRIDGIIDTDMPITRSYGAIESKTHGNVLWAPLDHGATRIGYAYSAAIAAKYPDGITQAIAEHEAAESMKPFRVTFRETHWWTLYAIGQRMAGGDNWTAHGGRVVLCGDAAHTHSSGAAQGLNTGIHDAVNLAWKLAMRVRGQVGPAPSQPGHPGSSGSSGSSGPGAVLQTYGVERRSVVEQLLSYDRDISTLMSHKWPDWYTGDRDADPYVLLADIFTKATSFNTGLGIFYGNNVLNKDPVSPFSSVLPGHRPPDVALSTPGTGQAVRFQQATRNWGCFWVVVFSGAIGASTEASLDELAAFLGSNTIGSSSAVRYLTICGTPGSTSGSPYEALGGREPFGRIFYDLDGSAHEKMGVSLEKGAVLIVRPDGLLGTSGPVEGSCIKAYFDNVLV